MKLTQAVGEFSEQTEWIQTSLNALILLKTEKIKWSQMAVEDLREIEDVVGVHLMPKADKLTIRWFC